MPDLTTCDCNHCRIWQKLLELTTAALRTVQDGVDPDVVGAHILSVAALDADLSATTEAIEALLSEASGLPDDAPQN